MAKQTLRRLKSLTEQLGWTREGDEWFPFAKLDGMILFVNPDNWSESYWTEDFSEVEDGT